MHWCNKETEAVFCQPGGNSWTVLCQPGGNSRVLAIEQGRLQCSCGAGQKFSSAAVYLSIAVLLQFRETSWVSPIGSRPSLMQHHHSAKPTRDIHHFTIRGDSELMDLLISVTITDFSSN